MSEKLKESLSAVIDGEADEFELRRVLDEIGKDPRLAASWERYHLIGAVMRRERIVKSFRMRDLVWAEVGLEARVDVAPPEAPPVPEPAAVDSTPRLGRGASLAVAATLVLAVAVGFLGVVELDGPTTPALVEAPSLAQPLIVADAPATLPSQVTLTSEVTPVDRVRTDAYVIRHLQQLGMNRSGIGFAKMVAYERD